MSKSITQTDDYCSGMVSSRDEDRWLAAQYASGEARERLIALYAFQIELRRIPSAVTEAPLGEIRLQWWRDAMDEICAGKMPRAHPVVEKLAEARVFEKAGTKEAFRAIDANARLLYGRDFSDIDDLAGWFGKAEGAVDAAAVKVLGGDDALAEAAGRAGAAFALAREGGGLAPSLAANIPDKVARILNDERAALKSAQGETAPAILHLSLARPYLKSGRMLFPVAKRLRLFSAMAFGAF